MCSLLHVFTFLHSDQNGWCCRLSPLQLLFCISKSDLTTVIKGNCNKYCYRCCCLSGQQWNRSTTPSLSWQCNLIVSRFFGAKWKFLITRCMRTMTAKTKCHTAAGKVSLTNCQSNFCLKLSSTLTDQCQDPNVVRFTFLWYYIML
jgi:hypothetical protein